MAEKYSNEHFPFEATETLSIPSKTILLEEGKVADKIYLIRKGCLRLFFYNEGKNITFQFFFEGDFVASFDSLYKGTPSLFSLESIEPSEVLFIKKEDFYNKIESNPSLRQLYEEKIIERFSFYQHLFLSRIEYTTAEIRRTVEGISKHHTTGAATLHSFLSWHHSRFTVPHQESPLNSISLQLLSSVSDKVMTFAPLNLEMYEKSFCICNRLDFNRCIHHVCHFRHWSAHSRTWEQPRSMA